MENLIFVAALPVFIASLVVFLIHPRLVKIAKKKQIVDNPNARKLNKVPVPVLGGVGVFFGLMFGLGVAGYYVQNMEIQFELIIAMMVMLYTGVGDDIMDISPTTRFALQIFTVCLMMFLCGIYIDNFHGLWNIYRLPLGIAIVLTLISGVGIINSINLIDGVDGLCSGYGMFASLLFGICFVRMGDTSYAVLAFSMFGALIPFMMHNMFGAKYKMFLGDGGSLVLGFICSLYVMRIIQSGSEHITGSSVSFTLAVLRHAARDDGAHAEGALAFQRRQDPSSPHVHTVGIQPRADFGKHAYSQRTGGRGVACVQRVRPLSRDAALRHRRRGVDPDERTLLHDGLRRDALSVEIRRDATIRREAQPAPFGRSAEGAQRAGQHLV